MFQKFKIKASLLLFTFFGLFLEFFKFTMMVWASVFLLIGWLMQTQGVNSMLEVLGDWNTILRITSLWSHVSICLKPHILAHRSLLLHTLTSLYGTLFIFNMSIHHCQVSLSSFSTILWSIKWVSTLQWINLAVPAILIDRFPGLYL